MDSSGKKDVFYKFDSNSSDGRTNDDTIVMGASTGDAGFGIVLLLDWISFVA